MFYAYIPRILRTVISYIILEFFSLVRFNVIAGPSRMMFSGIAIAAPFSHYTAFVFLIVRRLIKAYIFGMSLFNPLVYYIPTMIASGYWFSSNRVFRLGVPLACIFLFNVHPIGWQASIYSWYWLIPLIVHFLPNRVPFFEALGTTFVAHAVGSVLWLYSFSMPASYWLSLLPVVFIERLLFASGITIIYYVTPYLLQLCSTIVYRYDNRAIKA